MHLTLKNIGIIKNNTINFNGLSVIAGENDTGKSTVGKLMFAIVKALSRYEQDFKENKEEYVSKEIENIYFDLRKIVTTYPCPLKKAKLNT